MQEVERFLPELQEQFSPSDSGDTEKAQVNGFEELQHRIEELERQLQNTEEEKYFLQEQFIAQIRDLEITRTIAEAGI